MSILNPPDAAPCVFVGGTLGFDAMAVPANTAMTRASGRAALYSHYTAILASAQDGTLAGVAAAWRGTGASVAEFGTFSPSFFQAGHEFDSYYGAYGLTVQNCNVNIDGGYFNPNLTPSSGPTPAALLATYQAFVDAGKARGIAGFAPFVNPNTDADLSLPWTDAQWALTRQACLYGGGIALDIPCSWFFGQSRSTTLARLQYQQFCVQQVLWGLANGLRVSLVVSPYYEGTELLQYARLLYSFFASANALPTEWVVENYDTSATKSDGTPTQSGASPIASETTPGSVTESGLWFARHAAVAGTRLPAGDMAGQNSAALGPLTIPADLSKMATTGLFPNTGLTIGWNFTPGRGEVALLCGPQGGRGGLTIYALDSNGGVVGPMLDIDAGGNVAASGNLSAPGTLTVRGTATVGDVILEASGVTFYAGTGAPTQDLAPGSLYSRADASPGTTLYVKRGPGVGAWFAIA